MLVLSRKKHEQIVIADSIVLSVVEIRGDKVRIGIQADKSIPIHRQEVHVLIQEEGTLLPFCIDSLGQASRLFVALKQLTYDVSRGALGADSLDRANELLAELEAV